MGACWSKLSSKVLEVGLHVIHLSFYILNLLREMSKDLRINFNLFLSCGRELMVIIFISKHLGT